MLLSTLLVATLSAFSTPQADPSVSLVRVYEARAERAASAAPALASPVVDLVTAAMTVSAPVKLLDRAPVTLPGSQELPFDGGPGVSGDTRQILALLLGLLVGFGLGHLVARDTNGFVLFLIVDLVIISVATFVFFYTPFKLLHLALLISHIIQGLDAYAKAGGERIVQMTRERAVRLAGLPGREEVGVTTTRAFAFSF